MTTLQTINAAANWHLRVNENFKSVSPAASFGIKDSTTTGLTLGYYGGILDGVSYADGTHLLTASTTRYVVAARATGVVSSATGTTNWNDTATYKRMGVAVVGASTITSWTDWREFSAGATGSGSGDVVGPASSVSGNLATFSGTSGKVIQDSGTALSSLATTAYVDGLVQGLSWKKAVRAATTVAGTLASSFENGDAIDGVTLATGDRILVKNQASGSENGIYTVNASGAPTRATDADTGAEMVNATVFVSEGTTLADTQWTCSTNAPITIGSTSIAFAQLSAGGGASWGSITGTLSSQADLQAALDAKAAVGIPQNSQSTAYTLVLGDANKHILHPSADTTARTFTIPANSSVAYPIGTALTFVNQNGAGVITISITTDTMRLAGPGSTGNRSLAANGICTALKLTSTEWIISGTGLT